MVERWRPCGACPGEQPEVRGALRGECLLSFGVEARIPTTKLRRQFAVQNMRPDLKQQVGSARRPMHPLLFHESFGHKLVDGGLYEAGGNTLATSVPLAVVDDGIGIVVDIGGKLVKGASELLEHHRRWSVRFPIVFLGNVHLIDEISQRAVCSDQIAMPEEPLHALELGEEGLLAHAAQARVVFRSCSTRIAT